MKVSICSYMGFDSLNGSNLRVYHFTNELIRRGNDVIFIVPNVDAARSCSERFGTDAIEVGLEITRFNKSSLKKYPFYSWKASRRVPTDSDLVFGQSLPAALAVRLVNGRARKVIDYVDLWSEYWRYGHCGLKGAVSYRILRKAESYSMKRQDIVFTITKQFSNMIKERGCRPSAIKIVRDGVDTRMFRPMKIPKKFMEKYGLKKGTDYITYQGGIGIWDGVQFLVDAAPMVLKDFPEAKFLIVGEGSYAPMVKEKVKKMRLENNFIFTGWAQYEDMPFFMNVSKINVVPIPDAPCMSGVLTLKLFEAMSCGLPTIINGLPGIREHVMHEKTAYFVKPENAESLAHGIKEMLENAKLRKEISSNGLKIIPNYDWKKIANEMVNEIQPD